MTTMMNKLRDPFRSGFRMSAAVLLCVIPCACSGGGSGGVSNFAPAPGAHPSAAASPIVVGGKLTVYLASEALSGAGGTNFNAANGDVDMGDDCAVVVDMTTAVETDLNVATIAASIIGTDVYLIVSEAADNKDWNLDADMADTVLLHYSSLLPLAYVDDIATGTKSWATAGGRLYYVRGTTTGLVNGDSTLAYLATTAPTTPVTVLQDDATNVLEVHILAVDEDLIFLTADEVVETIDLNGDADALDPFVLHLLDGTNVSGVIQNVHLSVKDASTPVRAHVTAAHDWLVGFLVEEATQSDFVTGLNDPTVGAFGFGGAWKPTNCAGYVDADTLDNVLHILKYALWSANPVLNPPKNTGIPGVDRVLCTSTAVATLVLETDDGGCDLNADGDTTDEILRWVLAATPALPFGNAAQLNAVEDATPGGTHGVTDLAGKWISVVSELDDNTDHDGDALKTHNLVAWLDPSAGTPTWVFDHSANPGIQPAGATAMIERPERDRLLVAFQESVINLAINTGDNDKLDSTPTFVRFDPNDPTDLDFPGPAVAIAATNPGIVIANGYAIYRVDEAADNRDWNGDGLLDDFVFFRTNISSNFSALLGSGVRATANNLNGPSVISTGTLGAAYLADETAANFDLNGDGVISGFAVMWFRIG
jgi:hypothetical protein